MFITPLSVDVTDSSEHWATDDAFVKVNCDATCFRTGVGWIARDVIVILFRLKNLNILCIKRSENKMAICLACLSFTIRLYLTVRRFVPAGF